MVHRKKQLSKAQLKFNIGDQIEFTLEGKKFAGTIKKRYINSFLIGFHSDDPELVDKYHNRTVINNQNLKLIKAAPKRTKTSNK